jgi:hypothetical protein
MCKTITNVASNNFMPMLLVGLDKEEVPVYPSVSSEEWIYDPVEQTSNMLDIIEKEALEKTNISCTGFFGDSAPTTTSPVAGTTGFIHTDSDESNDDEGTD